MDKLIFITMASVLIITSVLSIQNLNNLNDGRVEKTVNQIVSLKN